MPIEWTPEQRQGITLVGKSLLVSAAAGSGKTTVLAQRCVHLICDAKPPCGASDLLVVTFTEAAASEMKRRIQNALAQRHAQNPTPHTARQIALIDGAAISTLHHFCASLLRENFHFLGIDPGFRILDADESELLQLEIARDLLADRYDDDNDAAFRRFIDCYGEGDDEKITRLILHAHQTLASLVDSADWNRRALLRIAEPIDRPLMQSELGRQCIDSVRGSLESLLQTCVQTGRDIDQTGAFPQYVEHLRELWKIIRHWIDVLTQHGPDALAEESAVELPRLPTVSSKLPGKELAQARVNAVKDEMKSGEWRTTALFTEREWKDGLIAIQPHATVFLSLVEEFACRYSKAKDEENALDFSDLEQLSLSILRDGTASPPRPSALALSLQSRFKHVLVDEYQDINEVQDAILSLVSRECFAGQPGVTPNLFCVGDVKQSIYRFRLAEPGLFLRRSDDYSRSSSHGRVIDLQQNFRSRHPLLEAINGVFEKLMTRQAADLDYGESQRLKPGATFPQHPAFPAFTGSPIELNLLPAQAVEEPDAEDLDRVQREAVLVAGRILEMTGRADRPAMHVIDRSGESRPVRLGDIVVLLRSMKFKSDQFAQTLRDAGIAVHSESSTGYFQATEITDVLSLLKLLDNARQDYPLAAVLRSPLSALPEPENCLARIRLAFPDDEFHRAAARCADEIDDELAAALRDFFKQIESWRQLARQRPLAEVLWTLYDQTGFLAFCSGLPDGRQRQANLIELHNRARQFGTFRRQGLRRFLEFLEKLQADADLGQAALASDADDVVRILSIHRSKGLEFPVVILPDLGKQINFMDARGAVLLDRSAGLGLDVIDLHRQIRYPSLASTVVRQRIRQQTVAEEMRVLYVAMTRAREHLILVGSCNEDQPEQWASRWKDHAGALPAQTVLAARSMLDWLGPAAVLSNGMVKLEMHDLQQIADMVARHVSQRPINPDLAALRPLADAASTPLADEVIHRLSATYPFQALARARAAQSVTDQAKPVSPAVDVERILPMPAALQSKSPLTAADRGTATHTVLEHLDFSDVADSAAILRQIQSMLADRRLDPTSADAVDLDAIQWLMDQEVGRLLRASGADLLREVPVYFSAPAGQRTSDPMDQIMLRGRLDVLIRTPDGLIIVDYKTDRVEGEGIAARCEVYRPQLELYRDAIERIGGGKVLKSILVFLHPRECREV